MIYVISMIGACCFLKPMKNNFSKENMKNKKTFVVIAFLFLLLPMALRYGIGTDYFYTYEPYFHFVGEGKKYFTEMGFNILNKIIYVCTGDFKVLIFITSYIIISFFLKGIIDNSSDRIFSVMLLFLAQIYFYSMNMIRQAIAIAIIFWGFNYLLKKEKNKYLICCLIASLFHISALCMCLLCFLENIELKNRTKIILVLAAFLVSPIFQFAVEEIAKTTKYAKYFNSVYDQKSVGTIVTFLNIFLFVLDLIYSKRNVDNKKYIWLSNINFIGILFLIFAGFLPLSARLIRYISVFQVLFIPEIIASEKGRNSKFLLKFFIFNIYFCTMYYQIFYLGGDQVWPYMSIFDIEKNI